MEARYVFHITYHPGHEQAQELIGFLKDVASCSDKLSCRMSEIENPVLEFTLLKDDVETGIKFRGIPGGHEFTSLPSLRPGAKTATREAFSKNGSPAPVFV